MLAKSSSGAVSRRVLHALSIVLVYALLVLVAVITVFPFLWMVSTSLKEPSAALIIPPRWIPNPFVLNNYTGLFTMRVLPFSRFIFNSTYIAAIVVLGRVFVCSLAGYAFARFEFPERTFAFAMLIGSMMIPSMVSVVPLYLGYKYVGWLDTHLTLIVAPIVANTFGTFLMRQFMMTLPNDLEEAARMDGATSFGIYWRIMLPLSKPVLATLAIFTLMNSWNDFFHPLVFISSVDKYTLPVGLAFFQGEPGSSTTAYTQLMAGATIAIMPILVVYVFAQRYFVEGIALTGIKG